MAGKQAELERLKPKSWYSSFTILWQESWACPFITFIRSYGIADQLFELFDCESTGKQDCDVNVDVHRTYGVLSSGVIAICTSLHSSSGSPHQLQPKSSYKCKKSVNKLVFWLLSHQRFIFVVAFVVLLYSWCTCSILMSLLQAINHHTCCTYNGRI